MFTGLIQAQGKIRSLADDRVEISIDSAEAEVILADLAIGDSIAVDGVCLTAERLLPQGFVAAVSPETWQRSTLGRYPHQPVNLETSLRVGGKIGGHFVTGHVDGWGQLDSVLTTGSAWELGFILSPPQPQQEPMDKYIVPKGSVAVNGISLTVARCQGDRFTVAVIPHTYQATNLSALAVGSLVNLEADVLSKYVEKLIRPSASPPAITPEFLAEHGYG
jgi:riboflavin synthase